MLQKTKGAPKRKRSEQTKVLFFVHAVYQRNVRVYFVRHSFVPTMASKIFTLRIFFIGPVNVQSGKPEATQLKLVENPLTGGYVWKPGIQAIAKCEAVPHEYREFLVIQRPEVEALVLHLPKACHYMTAWDFNARAELDFDTLLETKFFKHWTREEDKYFYWNIDRHSEFQRAMDWFSEQGHYMVGWSFEPPLK
jgi:hypothetical protein